MKKRIISVMAVLALMSGSMFINNAQAQIFMLDYLEEESSDRIGLAQVEGFDLPTTPQLGITLDQYAPVGSGIAVLAALGGAYLLGKKRKKD